MVITADIDMAAVAEARGKVPSLTHDRPFEIVAASRGDDQGGVMIKYPLQCDSDHQFEAWFASSAAYDKQAKRGLVACPQCGSAKVEKAIMAPNVGVKGNARRRHRHHPPRRRT